MQSLSMIALIVVASVVAAFELREFFMGWYSETVPNLTALNYAIGGVYIALCLAVALITFLRLTIPN